MLRVRIWKSHLKLSEAILYWRKNFGRDCPILLGVERSFTRSANTRGKQL
jgi:hypothetical protein